MGLFLTLINLKIHLIWLQIFTHKSLPKDAENKQKRIKILLSKLRKYNPAKLKKDESQRRNLKYCRKIVK